MLKNQFPPNIAHTKLNKFTVIVSISLLKWFLLLCFRVKMDQFTEYKASKDNYLVADSAYLKSLEFIKKPPD